MTQPKAAWRFLASENGQMLLVACLLAVAFGSIWWNQYYRFTVPIWRIFIASLWLTIAFSWGHAEGSGSFRKWREGFRTTWARGILKIVNFAMSLAWLAAVSIVGFNHRTQLGLIGVSAVGLIISLLNAWLERRDERTRAVRELLASP